MEDKGDLDKSRDDEMTLGKKKDAKDPVSAMLSYPYLHQLYGDEIHAYYSSPKYFERYLTPVLRQTRINPQLVNPIYLCEHEDGGISLKQERQVDLDETVLDLLRELHHHIKVAPQKDYNSTVVGSYPRLRIIYNASTKTITLQNDSLSQVTIEVACISVLDHVMSVINNPLSPEDDEDDLTMDD